MSQYPSYHQQLLAVYNIPVLGTGYLFATTQSHY